ncbi:MAG: SPOR domain-containing protein [Alphaproteobacteria bacterium]
MDEFEKIRAFSAELGKKTEEAVAVENETLPEKKEAETEAEEKTEQADFLENWSTPSEAGEETRPLSKTFWLVFVGVTLLVGCLIGVVYLLLKGPIENEEVVTIAPTPTPVKVRPENPGGMVIPDQDKVIYSRLTQDTLPVKVEKLFPEEEKPVMPEVVAEPVIPPEIPVFEEVEEVKVVQAEEPIQAKPVKKVEPVVEKKVEKASVKRTKAPKGEWKVQLFSSTDKAKVEKQWQVISKKQKTLVSDMPMQIVPAEIAGKGTFYRLQVGAFETREMAASLCAKLKKQKQDCIPAK